MLFETSILIDLGYEQIFRTSELEYGNSQIQISRNVLTCIY